jgi:hypothetical protein
MTFHESREQFRKSYAAGRNAHQRVQDDGRSHTVMLVSTVLGAVLYVVLKHYTTWSLALQIAVPVAAMGLAQYLAYRFFKRLPSKADRS